MDPFNDGFMEVDENSPKSPKMGSDSPSREYLLKTLALWNGEAKDLFDKWKWKSWITEVDKQEDMGRSDFGYDWHAESVMRACLDENKSYIRCIRKKLKADQKELFEQLLLDYESELLMKDVKDHKEGNPKCYQSEDYGRGSGDSFNRSRSSTPQQQRSWSSGTGRLSSASTVIAESEEETGGVLFQDLDESVPASSFYSSRAEEYKTTPNNKRAIKSSTTSGGLFQRKRHCSGSSSGSDNYKKLPVTFKRRDRVQTSTSTNANGAVENGFDYPEAQDRLTDKDSKALHPIRRISHESDLYFENPTPPRSPVGDAIPENSSRSAAATHSKRISIKTVRTDERCSVCERPIEFGKNCATCTTIRRQGQRPERGTMRSKDNPTTPRAKTLFPNLSGCSSASTNSGKNFTPFSHANKKIPQDDEDNWEDAPNVPPLAIDEPNPTDDKENYPGSNEEIIAKYPKPATSPSLTLEMFDFIKEKLQIERPRNEIDEKEKLVSGFGLNVHRGELLIIERNDWLIDLNLDFYLEMIRERNKQNPEWPNIYIFYCFFANLLFSEGQEAVAYTADNDDIFSYDLIFIPVHLSQHWKLAVVKNSERKLMLYDSMFTSKVETIETIYEYLKLEKIRHRRRTDKSDDVDVSDIEKEFADPKLEKDTLINVSQVFNNNNTIPSPEEMQVDTDSTEEIQSNPNRWTLYLNPTPIVQSNSIDCGIFVMMYADYLSRKCEFDFKQEHGLYLRKRVLYELLTKNLLTTPNLGQTQPPQDSSSSAPTPMSMSS